MDIHENARLTPLGREHMVNMVLGGQTPKAAGEAVGVCPRTVRKWVERYRAEGECPIICVREIHGVLRSADRSR